MCVIIVCVVCWALYSVRKCAKCSLSSLLHLLMQRARIPGASNFYTWVRKITYIFLWSLRTYRQFALYWGLRYFNLRLWKFRCSSYSRKTTAVQSISCLELENTSNSLYVHGDTHIYIYMHRKIHTQGHVRAQKDIHTCTWTHRKRESTLLVSARVNRSSLFAFYCSKDCTRQFKLKQVQTRARVNLATIPVVSSRPDSGSWWPSKRQKFYFSVSGRRSCV